MGYCATYSKEVMPLINSILTNTVALTIRNNLNSSNSKMSCTLERLSSGLKINRVKDDTANSIISSKLNLQLSGLDIVNKNAMHDRIAYIVLRYQRLPLYRFIYA